MRQPWWISIAFLASTALSIETLPFTAPKDAAAGLEVLKILKRQNNNCPSGYNPCTDLGDAAACCQADTICTKDAADNIACCPSGATCTGTLTATPASGDTTTSSFRFVQSNSAATTSTSGPNAISVTGPTLTGAAYPFVVIPTTFADAATCSAYYSLCANEYTSCTSALEGRYGVTVAAGGGGGVTAGGANPSNAASTCSSLSLEACHGLQINYCATYPTAVAASNRAASRPRPQKKFQDVVVGVAVGFAGMLI